MGLQFDEKTHNPGMLQQSPIEPRKMKGITESLHNINNTAFPEGKLQLGKNILGIDICSKGKLFKELIALWMHDKNSEKRDLKKKKNFTSGFNPSFPFSFSVGGAAAERNPGSWWES